MAKAQRCSPHGVVLEVVCQDRSQQGPARLLLDSHHHFLFLFHDSQRA